MEIWEEEHSASTGSNEEVPKKCTSKWTIQNFKKYYNIGVGRHIDSPVFHTTNSKHYLRIFPNSVDHSDFVSLALIQTDKNSIHSNVDFFIQDNTMQLKNKTRAERFGNEGTFVCPHFIGQHDLNDSAKKLMNGTDLTVVCTFVKYESMENILRDSKFECEKCQNNVSLINDLQKLLQNKLLTDVALVANGKKLYAHKLILIARSPVFAAMLQNDMEEKLKSEIEIKDIGVDALSEMLHFLYTEKVANMKDHFQDLLYLANKYDIEGLKLLCEKFMLSELTVDNAIEVFMLAETHNCRLLKPKLLKFMTENASKIIKNSQFQSHKKDLPSLLIDLLEAFA